MGDGTYGLQWIIGVESFGNLVISSHLHLFSGPLFLPFVTPDALLHVQEGHIFEDVHNQHCVYIWLSEAWNFSQHHLCCYNSSGLTVRSNSTFRIVIFVLPVSGPITEVGIVPIEVIGGRIATALQACSCKESQIMRQ